MKLSKSEEIVKLAIKVVNQEQKRKSRIESDLQVSRNSSQNC
jgi:hypothetical protein